LQVSPARARVVVRFAASAAQGAEPPAARRAKRGRARARAGSLTGAGSGTSGRDHSAARWRAPRFRSSGGGRPQQIQRRRRTALCGRKAALEAELCHLSRALVSQQAMVLTAPWPCATTSGLTVLCCSVLCPACSLCSVPPAQHCGTCDPAVALPFYRIQLIAYLMHDL
jgi:hypothetical protein